MTTNNDKMGLLTLVGSVPAHLHQSIIYNHSKQSKKHHLIGFQNHSLV